MDKLQKLLYEWEAKARYYDELIKIEDEVEKFSKASDILYARRTELDNCILQLQGFINSCSIAEIKNQQPLLHKANVIPPLAFKELRLNKRMSLREVSKATGVSAATIHRIEQGKEAEHSNVQKLACYYANGV